MKISEIKELTDQELKERMDAEKSRLDFLKINHSISPLDNPMQIKEIRRTVARCATELRQREANKL